MRNIYDVLKAEIHCNRFVLNDAVCVEYVCPIENEHLGIYAHSDYIIHVLSGKKTWRTLHGEWVMETGQTLYAKKGAAILTQSFDEEICMLIFFLDDDLIRESLRDMLPSSLADKELDVHRFSVAKLESKGYLSDFFGSMLGYFRGKDQPPEPLIRLKLKELLANLVYHGENHLLKAYLHSVTRNSEPSLTHIMENNFCYNLSLEEFARLTHRSLSKFKRDFFNHYQANPGKWLLQKRLAHAASMMNDTAKNISEIAFESGFESVSHFSRAFKEQFEVAPLAFRKAAGVAGRLRPAGVGTAETLAR